MDASPKVRVEVATEGPLAASRMVALIALGLLEGLKHDVLSLEEAERTLFGPRGAEVTAQARLAEEVIEVVHSSLFFEDYPDLFPNNHEERLQRRLEELQVQLVNYLKMTRHAVHIPDLPHWLADHLPNEERGMSG